MNQTAKPNIILIMADQLAAQALSLYGNKVAKTPNLERLASRGTVFTNGYSNNPLCVPSRASMLSGLWAPRIGVYDNGNDLPSSTPTMAHYLRHAGYWTELCGKMHFMVQISSTASTRGPSPTSIPPTISGSPIGRRALPLFPRARH